MAGDESKKKNASTRSVKKKKSEEGKLKHKKKLKSFGGSQEKSSKQKKKKNDKSQTSKWQAPDEGSRESMSRESEQPAGKSEGKSDAKVQELSSEGQKSALAFLAHFQALTSDQCSSEFGQVDSTASGASVGEDKLQTSNDPKIPCVEQTTVKVDGAFYHCNKISLDKGDRQWIVAQPPKDSQELFWRMVFEEQAPLVVVLGPAYEEGKRQWEEFFPEKKDAYKYFGKMYINTKKVEPDGVLTTFTFEVLPEGCSNSLTTKVIWSIGWGKGDMSQGNTCAKILQQMNKLDPGPIVSVSASGTGRSCLVAAVSLLAGRVSSGNYSNVADVAVAMRKQRAMAIPDKAHYGHIYAMLAVYLTVIEGRKDKGQYSDEDKGKWEQALQRFKDSVAPGISS